MSAERQANGRFGMGNCANPHGRPRKNRSMSEEIRRELAAKVTITENGKRKRVSKISANAKQIANQGASGDLRAAKIALDMAHKTDTEREGATRALGLTESDKVIVARFIERPKATDLFKDQRDVDAQPR